MKKTMKIELVVRFNDYNDDTESIVDTAIADLIYDKLNGEVLDSAEYVEVGEYNIEEKDD